MEYAYNVYEDSYNIAVNQWLDRKAIGSKRRKETFRNKQRRSRVLRNKYGFVAEGKMFSKLGKNYYCGHAKWEEWRNRGVAQRKSNGFAYHRDRKERLHINKTVIGGPDISTNAKKVFLDIAKSDYIPYAYLYDIAEKHWFACDTCQDCGFALLRIKK